MTTGDLNFSGTTGILTATGIAMSGRSNATSLTFRHSRADAPVAGYTASYEWSTDLTGWQASGATVGGVTVTITPTVMTDNPSPANDVIQVVATVTTGIAPKLFVRLKATLP